MSNHTPGPWVFSDNTKLGWKTNPYSVSVKRKGHFTAVADIPNRKLLTDEEKKANARLISAAPDLLEALKEITSDYAERFDLDDPSTNPGIKSSIKLARAAIAKATGEQA